MSFVRNKLYSKEYVGLDIDFTTTYSVDRRVQFNLFPTSAYPAGADRETWAGNIQLIRIAGTLNGGASDNITLCA